MADFSVGYDGSVAVIDVLSEAAREWIDEHVESEGWQWLGKSRLCIEPRYAAPIVDGMVEAGLTVE